MDEGKKKSLLDMRKKKVIVFFPFYDLVISVRAEIA